MSAQLGQGEAGRTRAGGGGGAQAPSPAGGTAFKVKQGGTSSPPLAVRASSLPLRSTHVVHPFHHCSGLPLVPRNRPLWGGPCGTGKRGTLAHTSARAHTLPPPRYSRELALVQKQLAKLELRFYGKPLPPEPAPFGHAAPSDTSGVPARRRARSGGGATPRATLSERRLRSELGVTRARMTALERAAEA